MTKSIVKEIFPDFDEYGVGEYQKIIETFGEIIIKVDEENYSGDSFVLLKSADKFGILIFGWGSCSGCDALAACHSIEEVDILIEDLRKDIKWFDSKEELKKYVFEHDWKGDYFWSSEEREDFLTQLKKFVK